MDKAINWFPRPFKKGNNEDEHANTLNRIIELVRSQFWLQFPERAHSIDAEYHVKALAEGASKLYAEKQQHKEMLDEAARNISILHSQIGRLEEEGSRIQEQLQQEKTAHYRNVQECNKAISERDKRIRAWQTSMQELNSRHAYEKSELETTLIAAKEKSERSLSSKMDSMKESFEENERRLKQNHMNHLTRLNEQHDALQKRLRKDIESANRALFNRERFSKLTDQELKLQFGELIGDIDYLARLEWKWDHKFWTNQRLAQLSETPRKLKKAIILDSIWGILNERIFCSPFRVLGEEGTELEDQWRATFKNEHTNGQVVDWPETSFEAERWRYETLTQCEEALEYKPSEHSPRTKLRKGFEENLATTKHDLSEVLKQVSDLDQALIQSIESVSEKAARMWVKFGTQRCRLVVILKNLSSNSDADDSDEEPENVLELVIKPELHRFGNSYGEDLDKELTVAGCEGLSTQVSMD